MKAKRFFGTVIIIAIIVMIPFALSKRQESALTGKGSSVDQIAVASLTGVIVGRSGGGVGVDPLVAFLEDVRERDNVKAVVLRVDSGGGSASASQEVHRALLKLREAGKPVVVTMGDVAASGGYYVSVAADHIIANPSTTTGSIGVIMQTLNISGFAEQHGFTLETLASGPNKDAGNPTKPMSEEQKAVMMELINDAYDQFVTAVAEGRSLPKEDVLQIADGRIITGRQAYELDLIDGFGGLEDAIAIAADMVGMEGKPRLLHPRPRREGLVDRLLRLSVGDGNGLIDGVMGHLLLDVLGAGPVPKLYY